MCATDQEKLSTTAWLQGKNNSIAVNIIIQQLTLALTTIIEHLTHTMKPA